MADRLVIRADANSRIGTGHVMRCIALGQAWADIGGEVVFMTCCDNPALLQRLRDENFSVVELSDPGELLPAPCLLPPDSWFVLDGYHFTIDDHRAIRKVGHKLLLIDDCNHLPEYECDILLNQNVTAESLNYHINSDAQLLLGPQFALLRREFLNVDATPSSRSPEAETNILVTMGGADPDNVTQKVIQALQQLSRPDMEVRVIVGPANSHLASLESAIQHSTSNIQLINSANMAELMRWADFSISAAGSTCWELLCMNVPFATVILADNQEAVARYLEEKGGVHCFGWVTPQFEDQVAEFFREVQPDAAGNQPSSIIDGLGGQRVVSCLME